MSDRERLIRRLIAAASFPYSMDSRSEIELLADYLIENGVVIPPCKVGDTVYYIAGKKVYKSKCHAITLQPSMQIHLYDYDGDNARYSTKNVFRTRAEAENELAKRGDKNDSTKMEL